MPPCLGRSGVSIFFIGVPLEGSWYKMTNAWNWNSPCLTHRRASTIMNTWWVILAFFFAIRCAGSLKLLIPSFRRAQRKLTSIIHYGDCEEFGGNQFGSVFLWSVCYIIMTPVHGILLRAITQPIKITRVKRGVLTIFCDNLKSTLKLCGLGVLFYIHVRNRPQETQPNWFQPKFDTDTLST